MRSRPFLSWRVCPPPGNHSLSARRLNYRSLPALFFPNATDSVGAAPFIFGSAGHLLSPSRLHIRYFFFLSQFSCALWLDPETLYERLPFAHKFPPRRLIMPISAPIVFHGDFRGDPSRCFEGTFVVFFGQRRWAFPAMGNQL